MTGTETRATLAGAMSDYETQRQSHLTYAAALAPRLIERLEWSADRLAAYRSQRLREMVRHAMDSSPWHRDRLSGVDPDRLDEASLRELPLCCARSPGRSSSAGSRRRTSRTRRRR